MAETMNVVVKEIVVNNNAKQIYVANGNIYNIVGCGESAGAQLTKIDEATEVELWNALGPDNNNDIPLAASLGQMSDFTQYGEEEKYLLEHISPESEEDAEVSTEDFSPTSWGDSLEEVQNKNNENIGNSSEYKVDNNYFDSAVDFLAHCNGEDFLELVRYAKTHGNTFFHCVKEVSDCINADDAYCSALIKLSRGLGEVVEKKAFELFATAYADETTKECFLEFWKALQVINYFC